MDTISREEYEAIIDDELFENEPDQYELLHELLSGMETMDSDEYDDKKDMLTNIDARRIIEYHEDCFGDYGE